MPKKPKFSREILLQEAYVIAREKGIEEVSARSLSKRLGCSIQPIYTHFPTVAALRQETFRYACRQFTREILSWRSDADPFQWIAACTIDLARNRPNLFKLIFLTCGFTSRSIPETMQDVMKNQRTTSRIMDLYGLDRDGCENVMLRGELFLLGIGTMVCSFHLEISDEEVDKLVAMTIADLVRGVKENPPGKLRF